MWMEEIRLTSWYGSLSHYLQGCFHQPVVYWKIRNITWVVYNPLSWIGSLSHFLSPVFVSPRFVNSPCSKKPGLLVAVAVASVVLVSNRCIPQYNGNQFSLYTLVNKHIAGWKMGAPDWVDVFPIQNGDIQASYVRNTGGELFSIIWLWDKHHIDWKKKVISR